MTSFLAMGTWQETQSLLREQVSQEHSNIKVRFITGYSEDTHTTQLPYLLCNQT